LKKNAHILAYWQAKQCGPWIALRDIKTICKAFKGTIVVMRMDGERCIDNTGYAQYVRARDKLRGGK
jgi:hypothetical protein